MIAGVLSTVALTAVRADVVAQRVEAREERRVRALRLRLRMRGPRAAHLASLLLGTPYVWGGSRPGGFDCSGLVQWVYSRVGVYLPRTTWMQRYVGRRVPLDRLRMGDVVFAYGYEHEAIYLGGGLVIEAPYTGARVRVWPMSRMPVIEARRMAW